MRNYKVWLLRDEFNVRAFNRQSAISQAAKMYKKRHYLDSELTLTQLSLLARVKEMKDYNIW